jgi:hypothetical protein
MSLRALRQWWDGDDDRPPLELVIKWITQSHYHVWSYEGVEVLKYVTADDAFHFNGGVYRRAAAPPPEGEEVRG